jgi:hypothetical protein
MSSFSLYSEDQRCCRFKKIIPAERLQSFYILHAVPGRLENWVTTVAANDMTRQGINYLTGGANANHHCWAPIIRNMTAIKEHESHILNDDYPWNVRADEAF